MPQSDGARRQRHIPDSQRGFRTGTARQASSRRRNAGRHSSPPRKLTRCMPAGSRAASVRKPLRESGMRRCLRAPSGCGIKTGIVPQLRKPYKVWFRRKKGWYVSFHNIRHIYIEICMTHLAMRPACLGEPVAFHGKPDALCGARPAQYAGSRARRLQGGRRRKAHSNRPKIRRVFHG